MELRKETKPMIGTNYHGDSDKAALYSSNSRKRPLSSFKSFDHQHYPDNSHRPATEELASKKPCLVVDTSRDCQPLCEALSSNESFSSGLIENECISRQDSSDGMLPRQPPESSGLSAYLEDIDSEEEELDEMVATPSTNTEGSSKPHSKDNLLSMMDRVDRDIATIEQRILSLESKQKELTESTTMSSVSSKTEPPVSMATTAFDEGVSDKSIIEVIYSENKQTARSSHGSESQGLFKGQYPLYYQPSETPFYWRNIKRYRQFRPELLKYLKNRKMSLFKKECSLCEEYDTLNSEWERKLDKWEKSQKKRSREIKNKEMFEKVFPELRSKSEQLRDQAERFNRSSSGVRAFGVVKSEAELDELAYELFEQEEAKGRHRLTHATLPSMILDDTERRVQFIDTNGVLKDPMALYRESKSTSLWTHEEKALFKEKFQMFPKNFEKISTFLPNKSVNECVRYYYLAKKNGNFKSLLRRSSAFKRRRHLKSSSNYSLSSPLLIDHAKNNKPHPQPATPTNVPSPPSKVEWSQEEVERLKEGLKMYGRAWGRVYKEVGGNKTATQCKQFYDDYCTDAELNLNSALAEHSARKNAERVEKKMAEMKQRVAVTTEPVIPEGVKTHNSEDDDGNVSDNSTTMETVSSQDGGDDDNDEEDSDSETTITDSGQEIDEDTANEEDSNSLIPSKAKLHPLKLSSTSFDNEPIQSPLDIFLSAAEALSNTVPSEVALHDHTYSCPPLDIHGSSGLQLIAAAAAVVSPGLSRGNSWSTKQPSLSQPHHHQAMKAPRGRPPSTQKRSSSTSQRIGPSYLTPTSGSSQNVLLQQDLKPTLRGRSRSAPTEKPRSSLPQKSPAIASPLLLKSGPKVYPTSQPIIRGTNSPLTYSSKSKDSSGSNLISLKAASSSGSGHTDSITTINSTNAILQEHKSVAMPINLTSKTASVSAGANRSSNTGNNPVLELNLGNMALLLAASGSNQQATLLLPPSSLFNKHTLAVLHGSSLTDSAATLSVDTPSSFTIAKHSKPTISIDLSKTDNSIPLVAPLKASQTVGGKPTLTLSLTPSASLSFSRPKPTNSVTTVNTTSNAATSSSAPSVTPVTLPTTSVPVSLVLTSQKPHNVKTVTSAPVTPAATPTTDDLSNLNLLSNLVAGMSKEQQRVVSSTSMATTSKPQPIVTSTAITVKQQPTNNAILSNSKPAPVGNSMWKKQQPDLNKADTNNVPAHPVPLSYNSSPQQSLMLYTRSLPLNSANQGASPDEDEDHLEYATRGIDELTRLLGGGANDSNGLSDSSSTSKHPSQWSPDELLCNPFCSNTNADIQGTSSDKHLSITLASSTSASSSSTSSFNRPPLAASVLTTAGLESHSST